MNISFSDNNVIIKHNGDFDIKKTLECGQCFRFSGKEDNYQITAFDRVLKIHCSNNEIILENTGKEEFQKIWKPYFDLDRDYDEISKFLCKDKIVNKAYSYSRGIRLLAQDPWETLISFIISQNNNIPRIKKIINSLCENFGNKIEGTDEYSFPSPLTIVNAGIEGLAVIKSGFRAKYIYDAALKVNSGETELDKLRYLSHDDAQNELMKIKGVGVKVSECVLLFSLGFYDAFPVDTWVKKVIAKYYGEDFSCKSFGEYAGLAQQYLFYFERENESNQS